MRSSVLSEDDQEFKNMINRKLSFVKSNKRSEKNEKMNTENLPHEDSFKMNRKSRN